MTLHVLILTLEVFLQKNKEENIILEEDDITLEMPLGIYDMRERIVEYMYPQREVLNMASSCFMSSQ